MDRRSLTLASAILFVAVAFGAFGAHALKDRLAPDALAQWKTAVEYQFYHGLGVLLLAPLGGHLPAQRLRLVRALFGTGVVLFCGSIYLLSTRELLGHQAISSILGPFTPIGGLLLLAGWGVLFITALRSTDGR
jgi:uncharacterized membrane protein YgdD (TMEM256/DUF423 family)